MKRTIAISMALLLAIVCTTLSQDQRRPPQQRQAQPHPVFTLRGVEFTEEQQAEVEELRKKYMPKLMDIQGKHGGVLTDEQRRAQREALQAARKVGKQGRVLIEAVEASVRLTDEQKEAQAALRKERDDLFAQIQSELRSLLTDGQALKEKMAPLGIRCEVYAGQDLLGGGERISTIDFVKETFGMKSE